MNRHEAINLSFEVKKNPQNFDFSSLLYSAVGMIKLEKDSGAIFAAMKLVEAIEEVSNGNLSDFCKRRIEIIRKADMQRMARSLETLVKAYEIADYNAEMKAMEEACARDDLENEDFGDW